MPESNIPSLFLGSRVSRGSRGRNADSGLVNLIAGEKQIAVGNPDVFSKGTVSWDEILIVSSHAKRTPEKTRRRFHV
jgi:hypothetical protein